MQLTRQEMQHQFLNSIMKENDISLASIYECMEENKNEIDSINRIFSSNDELSIRKRFVLLFLISRDMVEENMKYYRAEIRMDAKTIKSDINQYKVLIVTALMSNTQFYINACNWHGLIRREVNRITEMKKRVGLTAEGFAEYLELEERIIEKAKDYPCEKLSAFKIHPADSQDTAKSIDASYNKGEITIPYSVEIQDKAFTLWILEEDREFEPIPISLRLDSKGNLHGRCEEEIPETGKFILWESKRTNREQTGNIYTIVTKRSGIGKVVFTQIEGRKAAAPKKKVFAEFFEHNITYKGISGTLRFMGNDQNQVCLEFKFDKYQNKIPFEMEVHFRTKQDHKHHIINLSKRENKDMKSFIRSDIINKVYYSKGIEGVDADET